MPKKLLLMVFVVILAGMFIAGCASSPSTNTTPGTTTSPSGGGGGAVTIDLVAKNIAFNMQTITVPHGATVTIHFDNEDQGVQHNFAVYTDSSASNNIFRGTPITGVAQTTYTFTAPATPGNYFFRCDIHPTIMTGTFTVT